VTVPAVDRVLVPVEQAAMVVVKGGSLMKRLDVLVSPHDFSFVWCECNVNLCKLIQGTVTLLHSLAYCYSENTNTQNIFSKSNNTCKM